MQIDLVRRAPASPASRVAPWAFALTALVVAVQMTLHLVDYGVYDLRIRALNSNLDRSAMPGSALWRSPWPSGPRPPSGGSAPHGAPGTPPW